MDSDRKVPTTLVLQSHRQPLPYKWLIPCLESVKAWARQEHFDYHFLDDELFELLPPWVLGKTQFQKVIATDLARLKWLQKALLSGYERVIWLDADCLIFAPEEFVMPDWQRLPERYVLGREVWIQPKESSKPAGKNPDKAALSGRREKYKANIKVHNAFLLFGRGNSFLDFYTSHAERLLEKVTGTMPPQFIGPKLLTALHNIVQCPVQENMGMLSPWVIRDILTGGGPALDLFREKSSHSLAGANLCSSLSGSDVYKDYEFTGGVFEDVVVHLLSQGSI